MFNHSLCNSVHSKENEGKLKQIGFTHKDDGTPDPRGWYWEYENDKFIIHIDAWFEVSLCRKTPEGETDYIIVQANDMFDLERLISFVS